MCLNKFFEDYITIFSEYWFFLYKKDETYKCPIAYIIIALAKTDNGLLFGYHPS